jgi:hypothetical protein
VSADHSEAQPLSREDRAILELESETIVGHTCKVVVCAAPVPDLEKLRARVAAGLADAPLLSRRLGGSDEAPAWVPCEDFDVERQVRLPVDEPLGEDGLREQVAHLFEQHLDRSRPLWAIDLLPLQGDGAAIVLRIHHALADGTSVIRYGRRLLWEPRERGDTEAHPAVHSAAADEQRRRHHLWGFVRRELGESLHASPFDGRIGRRRQIAFASLPLSRLHDAAKELAGATVNDAVLSVVAGALGRWVEERHGSLAAIRVRVPVSLHREGDEPGNRDSFFTVALPLNEPDPVARLREVREATAAGKSDHDAQRMDSLLTGLAHTSPGLERLAERVEGSPRRFAVSVSNVPGPRDPIQVLGAPVVALRGIAEVGRRHGLRVSVVSLAGTLHFGFCADPGIVEGLDSMASGVEEEGEALAAAAQD